jgi:hypothetical protein
MEAVMRVLSFIGLVRPLTMPDGLALGLAHRIEGAHETASQSSFQSQWPCSLGYFCLSPDAKSAG